MGRRKQDLAQLVGILLLTALVSGAAFYWLGRTGNSSAPTLTTCTMENEVGHPRCPPPPGTTVLGYWGSGSSATVSSATVTWDGNHWRLAVPGSSDVIVRYPDRWHDPARE